MIGGILWRAALFALACVTIGVQLDRQAVKSPELALKVPEVFRSSAQPRITALAIDTGVSDIGLVQARSLVRRRPLPARHLRLLAQAQFAAGETEASGLSIQYAAQRGWREPLAQEAMMRLALAAGDRAEAARRYAALFLLRRTDRSLLEEVGLEVFPSPGGEERAVFAEIVRGGDRWHATFLNRGAKVMPAEAFVDIVERSVTDGAKFDCSALRQAGRTIGPRDTQAGQQLAQLIQRLC